MPAWLGSVFVSPSASSRSPFVLAASALPAAPRRLLARSLLLVIAGVLLPAGFASASEPGATAAPVPGPGASQSTATVTTEPGAAGEELGTPVVDVAETPGSLHVAAVLALVGANVAMLGAGAVLLWRRCSVTRGGEPVAAR